jgi:hypothetical protein
MELTGDLVCAAFLLALFCLLGAACVTWPLSRPPRCPKCGGRAESGTTRMLSASPPVVEIAYDCTRCRRVVVRRYGVDAD